MSIAFIDIPEEHKQLWPLTMTRPAAALRVGIRTIKEKWEYYLGDTSGYYTETYLSEKYQKPADFKYLINGTVCPDQGLHDAISKLDNDEALVQDDKFIVAKTSSYSSIEGFRKIVYEGDLTIIDRPWDIFRNNGAQIVYDYQQITLDRHTAGLTDKHTRCYGNDIFVEEGAQIRAAILNAENGPIYIGKNAQIHEGSIIKGPFAICEGSHINMGAKIKGDTTIGPFSKVGGEVSNSVILGYSSKGHEGFLGNSVLGEWCNLGADTNNSNLKNNYANVKVWDYTSHRFSDTGLQFCGLIMGDHSKSGINTMFNTGTVVGISANIYGGGFPRNFIPSFSWGGSGGMITYRLNKVFETAQLVMQRRDVVLTEADKSIIEYIFNETAQFRVWEKK